MTQEEVVRAIYIIVTSIQKLGENLYVAGEGDLGNTLGCVRFTNNDENEIKNKLTSELGNNFVMDEKGINNGFPILLWQVSE